jgi:nucleotide-binding universal stress UspA family protein
MAPRRRARLTVAMADQVLLCTDGSDASIVALRQGLAVVRDGDVIVATVIDGPDPMLVTGTGFAGGTLTEEEYQEHEQGVQSEGDAVVEAANAALAIPGSTTVVLRGEPGQAICQYAEEQGVGVIVVGTRGHGGIKRALLGSVADHVVRNAPCPVVVVSNHD